MRIILVVVLFVCYSVMAQNVYTVVESSGLVPIGSVFTLDPESKTDIAFDRNGTNCISRVIWGGVYTNGLDCVMDDRVSHLYPYSVVTIGRTTVTNIGTIFGGWARTPQTVKINRTNTLFFSGRFEGGKKHYTNASNFLLVEPGYK